MGNKLRWDYDAWEDYLYWQTYDRGMLKRINLIIKETCRDPFRGLGKPEPLKGGLSGAWSRAWSRRIDGEHRLVYVVENDGILILSCRGHYDRL